MGFHCFPPICPHSGPHKKNRATQVGLCVLGDLTNDGATPPRPRPPVLHIPGTLVHAGDEEGKRPATPTPSPIRTPVLVAPGHIPETTLATGSSKIIGWSAMGPTAYRSPGPLHPRSSAHADLGPPQATNPGRRATGRGWAPCPGAGVPQWGWTKHTIRTVCPVVCSRRSVSPIPPGRTRGPQAPPCARPTPCPRHPATTRRNRRPVPGRKKGWPETFRGWSEQQKCRPCFSSPR